jgi:pimeloyl-ACP methyl ester carboxylesterase
MSKRGIHPHLGVPRISPLGGSTTLHLVFALVALALVGCSGSPQPHSENQRGCVPAQGMPSCFYKEDAEHQHTKLIIFVHGVFGGGASTWGDPQSETFWPAMVSKDSRFAAYDVYLLNYRTPFFGGAPNAHEIAGNELGRLMSRKVFERYDEIYVIAHSMGGLVTKSLLTRLNRGSDVVLLRRVKGVVYLSTPAQGADVASLAHGSRSILRWGIWSGRISTPTSKVLKINGSS